MKKILSFITYAAYAHAAYGAALHIGDATISLSPTRVTTPSLCVHINNETQYAPMYKSQNCKFCTVYNNEKYNIGMTFLDYIYFDGASYIDLGFSPSADLQFEIKAHMDNSVPNHDGCLLGARNGDGSTNGQYLVWYTNNRSYCNGEPHILPAFDNYAYAQIIVTDTPQTIRWRDNIFSVNDMVTGNIKPATNAPTPSNLALGAVMLDTTTDPRKFLGRVYYARFWHDNDLIMDLIPALDTFGTPGFYDIVSQQFLYNSGTGKFQYNL